MSRFVVTGNMGSGKTTFCKAFARILGAEYVKESVENNPFLKSAYEDRQSFNFALQSYFMLQRFAVAEKAGVAGSQVFDRYIYDSLRVFIPVQHEMGQLRESEFEILRTTGEALISLVKKPDFIIFLKSDPAACMARIVKRSRDFEKKVAAEYLQKLHVAYEGYVKSVDFCQVVVVPIEDYMSGAQTESAYDELILGLCKRYGWR